MTSRLFIYIITVTYLKRSQIINIRSFFRFINIATFIFIIIVILEFIAKNIFQSNIIFELFSEVFGVGNSTSTTLLLRGVTYSLQGLMREPAHLVESFLVIGLLMIVNLKGKFSAVNLFLIILFSFISLSLSGILIGLILVFVLIIKRLNVTTMILFSISAMLILLISLYNELGIIQYYFGRLVNVVNILFHGESLGITSSEDIRLTSIFVNLRIFLQYPIFGVGIGTTYAHSFLATLLSNGGLTLLLLWYYSVFRYNQKKFKQNRKNRSIYTFTLVIVLFVYFFVGNFSVIYSYSFFTYLYMLNKTNWM
jgi:hypothetical protein